MAIIYKIIKGKPISNGLVSEFVDAQRQLIKLYSPNIYYRSTISVPKNTDNDSGVGNSDNSNNENMGHAEVCGKLIP